VSDKGTDVHAEPMPGASASIEPELKDTYRSVNRDRAIQACHELLSSGHPLSQILDTVKRLTALNDASHSDAVEPDNTEPSNICAEARSPGPQWEAAQVEQPLDSTVGTKRRETLGALLLDTGHAGGALKVEQSRDTSRFAEAPRSTLRKTSVALLFWLVLATSLTVVVTAGKLLIDAGLPRRTAEAAAKAIPVAVQLGKDLHAVLSAHTKSRPASTTNLEPDGAESLLMQEQTTSSEDPERKPANPQNLEPQRAAAQTTPEEIQALLDRGDALVTTADVTSARLFYERAAAIGNAQAAIRLGATFDPAFLARAGLVSTRGDLAAAQQWYERARELGTSDADIQSSAQPADTARRAEQLATTSLATSVPKPAKTHQTKIQPADRRPVSGRIGKGTRSAALDASSLPARPTMAHARHTRTQRPTNGPACPHSGRCLTPP